MVLSMDGALDGPRTLAAADIDGDGRLDLVTAGSFSDDVAWFRQVSAGVFAPAVLVDTGGLLQDPLHLLAEDINSDGMIDLLVVGNESDNVVLFIQRPDREAFFLFNLDLPEGSAPVALTYGDLSGDRLPDIAVATRDGVSIFEQDGADFSLRGVSVSGEEYSPTGLLASDFNGNGRMDLVLADALPPGGIEILSASEGSDFSSSLVLSGEDVQAAGEGFLPAAIAHVDLDGDGEKDFVIANRSGDEITVFWGGRR